MKRIWSYVKQVERHLPRHRRVEVAGEIYATVKRKAEAEQASLGRRLTDAEIEAVLRGFGEPAAVAARFSSTAGGGHSLLERYLGAIARRLPVGQSYDILAELREAIGGQIEAREDELGRSLTDDDVAAILKAFGHPVIVASRYRQQDYLIGPQLYPWFWPAQRAAVGIVVGVLAVLMGIDLLDAARPVSGFIGVLDNLWGAALFTFGAVTAVFVIMERARSPLTQLVQAWNPRLLPEDHIRRPKTLFDSVFSLLCDVIFILWWVRWVSFPSTLSDGEGEVALHLSPAWEPVYMAILVLACVSAAAHLADIVHPGWSRLRSAVATLGYAGGVAVIWSLLSSGPLVELAVTPGAEDRVAQVEWLVNGPFRWSLIALAVIWSVAAVVEAGRQVRAIRPAAVTC